VATDAKSKSGLSIPKNLAFSKSQISEALKTRDELFQPIASVKTTGSKTKGFTIGSRKVLVLLIDFKDRPFAHLRQEYDDLMNMPGYNGTGSFRDYYKAVSYNQLTCETTVKGPYHANGTMAKYGANINGNKYTNAKLLVQEAVDAAHLDGVNFADYDNDGDGYVDAVIVVHSNNDEAQGAGSNAIWSHQSALRYGGMQRNYDGVTIDMYNIDPGVTGATGDAMGTIGVFCHEFGHALGLPDTYDIDYRRFNPF
jgi:M6 family metalloprotease-like protein